MLKEKKNIFASLIDVFFFLNQCKNKTKVLLFYSLASENCCSGFHLDLGEVDRFLIKTWRKVSDAEEKTWSDGSFETSTKMDGVWSKVLWCASSHYSVLLFLFSLVCWTGVQNPSLIQGFYVLWMMSAHFIALSLEYYVKNLSCLPDNVNMSLFPGGSCLFNE